MKFNDLENSPTNRVGNGFALVVTLSLMALLLIIALGLLSLSTIALRSSVADQADQSARSNARMALVMAIGQLQREMGPDSRISAPSDANSTPPPNGQPHWTVVYDAWTHDPAASSSPVVAHSRVPKFRNWLVSGDPAAASAAMVLMVGRGSLGASSAPADQVIVPMQQVVSGSSKGSIAWWISDESTKAKINAGPASAGNSTVASADPLFNAQAPPYLNQRVFPNLEKMEWKDGQRGFTVSTKELELAAATGPTAADTGGSFHDLTLHSAGVLADVSAGRLKRDLSNLLSRDVTDMKDKPLYLADGRMNRFSITKDGAVTNGPGISASGKNGDVWGINMEELYLFHNIFREIDWSTGGPMLLTKDNTTSPDRYYLYGKPSVEAMQFILSLKAVPDKVPGEFKMEMMIDGMVALSNPNDIQVRFPPGLTKSFGILSVPYDMTLKIDKADGSTLTAGPTKPGANRVFKGFIEGGTGGVPAAGFDLEPGEAAAFGSTTGVGINLNIRRGFVPGGGIRMTNWDLGAAKLKPNDKVDFELVKVTSARNSSNSNVYIQTPYEGSVLSQGRPDGDLLDRFLTPTIGPPSVLPVSAFTARPLPIMVFSLIKNTERKSDHADVLASRPYLLNETGTSDRTVLRYGPVNVPDGLHRGQLLYTSEQSNYDYNTVAKGALGRTVYQGGSRDPSSGGTEIAIKRRIPLVPPLSLGAFENAIASGFRGHGDNGGLNGSGNAEPPTTRAIGNSWTNPFVTSSATYQSGNTDPSWMVNTALWDTWFLSGIVDTSGLSSSSWMTDRRNARDQFMDFAESGKPLRNKRFIFHSNISPQQVATELFDGNKLKDSAINKLPNYLLVDGAFNVNSTSIPAWMAFLSSVRDQELIGTGGSKKKLDHSSGVPGNPFGTLGYAATIATSGDEGKWNGLRNLTTAEIDGLATAIVSEVKSRGPFLSLADFINRRPDGNPDQRALGALQRAIEVSGLNSRFTAEAEGTLTAADFQNLAGAENVAEEPSPAARAVGSAGYLSQGMLLTAMGSQITVRGDTFVIRAYGDYRNASNEVEAKAWCEAVVQREPEYIDPTDAPEAQGGWPSPSDKLTPANTQFGRKFEIISFRWLNPKEV